MITETRARHPLAPILLIAAAGVALRLADPGADHPLALWLLSYALFLLWLPFAIRLGPATPGRTLIVVATGLITLSGPLMGLLPDNICLLSGRCVF